jgi:hypothetical protein
MIENARKEYVTLKMDYAKMIKEAKINTWQKLLTESQDIYRLDKIIHKREQNNISLLEGCSSAKESISVLLDNYFPGSSQTTEEEEEVNNDKWIFNKDLLSINYINPEKVKEAFQDMEPLNASGPDGLKAIVFQQLLHNILVRLCKVYKACILLNHTPIKWCYADVIFLPKSNKTSYDTPNAFRPISKFGTHVF